MIERIFDRFDAQDERLLEMLKEMGEIKTELALLKAHNANTRGGVKLVGWLLVFAVNVVSVGVTYFIAK